MNHLARVRWLAPCPVTAQITAAKLLNVSLASVQTDKERKRIAQERDATKQLESQYYLEIVDAKHVRPENDILVSLARISLELTV